MTDRIKCRQDPRLFPARTHRRRPAALIAALGAAASRAATVRVRLYSQSIPPYYLEDRFDDGRMGPGKDDIGRLYYLTSHLNTGNDGGENAPTHIKDWKLQIGETCLTVAGQACP